MTTVPLMQFVGGDDDEPFFIEWNPDTFGVSCSLCNPAFPCSHIEYFEKRREMGPRFPLPNSADVSREEMEALADDVDLLRQWMLERLPIVRIDAEGWL